jgi:hypothetical protein
VAAVEVVAYDKAQRIVSGVFFARSILEVPTLRI